MSELDARLRAALEVGGTLRPGDRVVVALSGGLDSVVLLHVLRFGVREAGVELVAAHFDHAMRASSRDDARWVAGLCRAWGVPLSQSRAPLAPASEEEARAARYGFLEHVRARVGARLVLTAHHADDQAETVLFRALRGSGLAGLAGIPGRREPALWRPLLGFWRRELEAYAGRARLSWREDASNYETRFARNALRTHVLPEIERLVAPGARRALVRLGRLAGSDEEGWASVLPTLVERLEPARSRGAVSVDRAALIAHHPSVQARILRALAAELGIRLDEAGTRRALRFGAAGASGRSLQLGTGWVLERQLDRLVLRSARASGHRQRSVPLLIPDAGPGSGDALLSGARIRVAWGEASRPGLLGATGLWEHFGTGTLRFPLLVRGRAPGDRIRLASGTKKLKKLFLEVRIPLPLRDQTPLLVDAEGEVLWIPGVARAEPPREPMSLGALRIGIG